MQVDFYYLTAVPVERVLPRIAERVLDEGGRLLIVSSDVAQREALDRHLWTYQADSFLPHAQAGTGDDTTQPVLLADSVIGDNGARHVALADGAWRDEALGFDRVFHLFDDGRVDAARAVWRALADRDGVERRYWKQTGSGWERAA